MNFPETAETIETDFREIGPRRHRVFIEILGRPRLEDSVSDGRCGHREAQAFPSGRADRADGRGPGGEERTPFAGLRAMRRVASSVVFRPLMDRVGCLGMKSAYTGGTRSARGHPLLPLLRAQPEANVTDSPRRRHLPVQPDNEVKPETVGKALPETEVRIAEDQEVLVKSPSNFAGYYNDFKASEDAFRDGWLRTGMQGIWTPTATLSSSAQGGDHPEQDRGRISPDFIETRLKFSPYIKEAVTFGEGRPYITSFITSTWGTWETGPRRG